MFIGSSTEGLGVARALQAELQYDAEVTLWSQGVFGLSEGTLETLTRKVADFDFAVLVLTADDVVTKRATEGLSARDNVLFESGLFMGAVGRERTYLVAPGEESLEFPSDLAGVTISKYRSRRDGNMRAALGPVAEDIRQAMKRAGSPQYGRREQAASQDGRNRPGWGELQDAALDSALYVGDSDLYVHNPELARKDILEAIETSAVIPTRYHYTSDVLAARWIRRCREPAYRHQRNTLNFWRSAEGEAFAAAVSDGVEGRAFDFVSLGPGDGEKDAVLLQNWIRGGADVMYYPYDASYPLIVHAVQRVQTTLGRSIGLPVKAVLADFFHFEHVRAVFSHRSAPNVVAVLGNLGNLGSELEFLEILKNTMSEEDYLVLEVRLQSEVSLEQLSSGSSLEQDFGPLEQYFGLRFSPQLVSASWAKDLSDVPGTRTMLVTYNGDVPNLGARDVRLQYIHLYESTSFVNWVERVGFEVVHAYTASDKSPPFLECLLRRRQ